MRYGRAKALLWSVLAIAGGGLLWFALACAMPRPPRGAERILYLWPATCIVAAILSAVGLERLYAAEPRVLPGRWQISLSELLCAVVFTGALMTALNAYWSAKFLSSALVSIITGFGFVLGLLLAAREGYPRGTARLLRGLGHPLRIYGAVVFGGLVVLTLLRAVWGPRSRDILEFLRLLLLDPWMGGRSARVLSWVAWSGILSLPIGLFCCSVAKRLKRDGLPGDPARRAFEFRVFVELVCFAVGSVFFLAYLVQRSVAASILVAAFGFGLLMFLAWSDEPRIWGPPTRPEHERFVSCLREMAKVSLPVVALFAAIGVWRALHSHSAAAPLRERFLSPSFPAALACYVPWALMQQAVMQYYLLGRLRVLLAEPPNWLLAGVNAVIFGLLHLRSTDPALILLTVAGGAVWTWSYLRHRSLLPLAFSHALVGAAYFYWARGEDKLVAMMVSLFLGLER
jgi:hypothetical protein